MLLVVDFLDEFDSFFGILSQALFNIAQGWICWIDLFLQKFIMYHIQNQ